MKVKRIALAAAFTLLIPSMVSADFAVNGYSFSNSGVGLVGGDDFGNVYNVTVTSVTDGIAFGDSALLAAPGESVTISYDFSANSGDTSTEDTRTLGYYAKNFRLENIVVTGSASVSASARGSDNQGGRVDATWNPVPQPYTGGTVYFDLTNLSHVSVLNDLERLTFTIAATAPFATIGLENINLVATPEPTSLVSLATFAALGLFVTRRRKRA